MTFAVYIDHETCIGNVSAPDRESAVAFLVAQGYDEHAIELREIIE